MDTQIETKTGIRDQQVYSPCSSPSHEFSFTISFNPSSSSNNICDKNTSTLLSVDDDTNKCIPPPPPPLFSSALDLSPADDIFFHGHLLPLHLLPHLPTSLLSPRNSLESFTLPIRDPPQLQDHTSHHNNSNSNSDSISISISNNNQCNGNDVLDGEENGEEDTGIPIRPKAKSFSIFGKSRWRKESEINSEKERQKKKARFDVSHMLKRYMRMVKPLLSSMNMSNKRESRDQLINHKKQSHSYSGNVSLRYEDNDDSSFETRRREFSAPASMWTSPSNSGILVSKGKNSNSNLRTPSSSASSDSTMEELQAAIQAAITHCKNSIATDDKNQINRHGR